MELPHIDISTQESSITCPISTAIPILLIHRTSASLINGSVSGIRAHEKGRLFGWALRQEPVHGGHALSSWLLLRIESQYRTVVIARWYFFAWAVYPLLSVHLLFISSSLDSLLFWELILYVCESCIPGGVR
jgi:hypothetical protein